MPGVPPPPADPATQLAIDSLDRPFEDIVADIAAPTIERLLANQPIVRVEDFDTGGPGAIHVIDEDAVTREAYKAAIKEGRVEEREGVKARFMGKARKMLETRARRKASKIVNSAHIKQRIRNQVRSTKEFIRCFTDPYVPTPRHANERSLSISSMKEAGTRFQDAFSPYVDVLEAVARVSRWENPGRSAAWAIFYLWLWYANYLPYVYLLSPLIFLLITYMKTFHPTSFLQGHMDVTPTSPKEAETRIGVTASLSNAATESLSFAVHTAPANAAAWWKALGEAYGAGREGLGLLEDLSEILEKIKNLLTWKVPDKTLQIVLLYSGFVVTVLLIPLPTIFYLAELLIGWYFFVIQGLNHHFPRYKEEYDPIANFFRDVPSDADLDRTAKRKEKRDLKVKEEKERVQKELDKDYDENEEGTPHTKLLHLPPSTQILTSFPCIHTSPTSVLSSSWGTLYLTPTRLRFLPKFTKRVIKIKLQEVVKVRRVRIESILPGDGRGVAIELDGGVQYIFTSFPNRESALSTLRDAITSLGISLPTDDSPTQDTPPHSDEDEFSTDPSYSLYPSSDISDAGSTCSDLTDFAGYTTASYDASSHPHIQVSHPQTHTNALNIPTHTTYLVTITQLGISSRRRFRDFVALRQLLHKVNDHNLIQTSSSEESLDSSQPPDQTPESAGVEITAPALPDRVIFGRFDSKVIAERRDSLERFLNALATRPEVWSSEPFKRFIRGEKVKI
ncbi:hypothetical protein DFS34DRAFT_321203 [Phlyctochytrium arcticum]|nr:hypothetical protein DFS34DRAFT_321203 [Phlyctochytrium arcticum]